MPAHVREETPVEQGFRQPPEWAPHAATWAAWPFGEQHWKPHLEAVRDEFAALVAAIAVREPVRLLVADEEVEADARRRLSAVDRVSYFPVALDDVWLRDSGPIFVSRGETVAFVNFRFNAWGGKFEWKRDDRVPEAVASILDADHFDAAIILEGGSIDTNGEGVFLTTRQCLLHRGRNPHMSEAALDAALHDALGCEHLIWLDEGLEGDHTDGHVDTIARFVDPRTVVACVTDERTDPNHLVLARNAATLRAAGLRVVELPLPRGRREAHGLRLPLTYANFYILNGAVIVPLYGDPHDEAALDILRPLFADREVVGLSSAAIIHGGGSFHCLTQQQPAGPLWRKEAR
jgi:agmatine deiminase